METQAQTQMVIIEKKVAGGLGIEFENYLKGGIKHVLVIPSTQDYRPLPLDFVVSMFYLPKTLKSYNEGRWSMSEKDKELVINRAKELGLYIETGYGANEMEQPKVLYSEREIISFLERRRLKEINEIIENGSRHQKQILASAASSLFLKLDGQTIKLIEDGLGTAIEDSSESD